MSSQYVCFYVVMLLYSVNKSASSKILVVVPTPSISHQLPFRPLTQELARRGHDVTVLTTDPAFPKGKAPKNLTEIDVHDMSYDLWTKTFLALVTGKEDDFYTIIKIGIELIYKIFYIQINSIEMKKIINEMQHFDLIIAEDLVKPALILSHIFKAPLIQMSSFGRFWRDYDNIGAPIHPLLYPMYVQKKLYDLSYLDKIKVLKSSLQYELLVGDIAQRQDKVIKDIYGLDAPSLNELNNNIGMLFLNTHRIFEGNTPVPPTVIHIWGINNKPEKCLPEDLKYYMDASKNGVIYMSFGTNVDPANFPPERIQMFIKVFSKLPYNILWKWNQDVLPGKTENIRISKWFPQADLLRHPNIKLFITQGGLQSTDEAIVAGVPLIGIPMLADQWYNVEKYIFHGIGKKLEMETISEEKMLKTITEVTKNNRYRKNIQKLGALMRDEPMSGLQRAVWWTEHVLRHGGARHLRAPAANISWAQYLELELVCFVLVAFITVTVLIISVLRICFKFVTIYTLKKHKLN